MMGDGKRLGRVIAIGCVLMSSAAFAGAAELAAEAKPFGANGLTVLPNLVGHDGVPRFANAEAAAALAEPAVIAAAGWADRVEGRMRAAIGLDEGAWRAALAGQGCRFSDWRSLADWAVAEAATATRPLAALAAACGGTACLPPDGERFEAAIAILGLPGGDRAASESAPRFLEAARQLAVCGRVLPPPPPDAWDHQAGRIVFHGSGNDVIVPPPEAVLVVDAGGADVWRLAAPSPGRFLLAMDLGGDDGWEGDVTARLSAVAILDLAGDDRHASPGGGQGATLGGVALYLDAAGDDRYTAGDGAQASAQAGIAVLVDGGGSDVYQSGARSQAFAGPGGRALLWELGGDDRYQAGGEADPQNRGGPFSWAQGTATGRREGIGGGIAVLREDAGDDLYRAGMFAQGAGYYDGIGILADRAGADSYQAARYAQGAGIHRGIGALADAGGSDSYALSVGVGQGMGLDIAVGLLSDGGGDDSYRAGALAQAASTANGIGMLEDRGGHDRFQLDGPGWGQDHWARGLPGLGYLLGTGGEDVFTPAGGPRNALPPQPDPTGTHACPALPSAAPPTDWLAAVRRSWPGNGFGEAELAAAAGLAAALPDHLAAMLAALPGDDFGTAFTFREVARCWLIQASDEARKRAGEQLLRHTAERPGHLAWVAGFLLGRTGLDRDRLVTGAERLAANPSCRARAQGLRLLKGEAPDHPLVAAAVRDPCFEARAAVQPWPSP